MLTLSKAGVVSFAGRWCTDVVAEQTAVCMCSDTLFHQVHSMGCPPECSLILSGSQQIQFPT